jgi:7 transmembrane receptor (rhodopsin family)
MALENSQNVNTTSCTNDYCISDADYIEKIHSYIFPSIFEWAVVTLYIAVFVIGLIGNCLVCFVVYNNQYMRTVTNLFIVNLSTADLLVIIACLPATVIGDITETWFLGRVACKIIPFIQVTYAVWAFCLACLMKHFGINSFVSGSFIVV